MHRLKTSLLRYRFCFDTVPRLRLADDEFVHQPLYRLKIVSLLRRMSGLACQATLRDVAIMRKAPEIPVARSLDRNQMRSVRADDAVRGRAVAQASATRTSSRGALTRRAETKGDKMTSNQTRIGLLAWLTLSITAGWLPSTWIVKNPGDRDCGLRYYLPKPYLTVKPLINKSGEPVAGFVSLEQVVLPDFSEEYSIHVRTGLGTNDTQIKLTNGWRLDSPGVF